jgi:hypothetical protein
MGGNAILTFNVPFGSILHDNAVVGLDFYGYTRDPANGSYSSTESQFHFPAPGGTAQINGLLIENTRIRGFVEGFDLGVNDWRQFYSPNRSQNLLFRRNQIVGNYPNAPYNASGILIAGVDGGPAGYLFYENTIDHNGWNTGCCGHSITWAPSSGFSHNLYLTGTQVNGDPFSTASAPTLTGNIVANDGSSSTFRNGGLYTHNLFVSNPGSIPVIQPETRANLIDWNVVTAGVSQPASGSGGPAATSRYINENVNNGSMTITNNLVSSALDPGGSGILIVNTFRNTSSNNSTVSGNILYNWSQTNTGQALPTLSGSILTTSVFAAGSGYTDRSTSIISAQTSSTGFKAGNLTWRSDGQNYIILKVTDATNFALYGTVYATSGGLSGAYQATVLDQGKNTPPQYVILYGTSFSTTFTGTLYYPWYRVTLSCVSCANGGSARGAQSDIISAGGQIVAIYPIGSDNSWVGETYNSAGINYTVNDTLNAVPGAACNGNGTVCSHGWSWNGTTNTGSGMQIKVNSLAVNRVAAAGCNFTTNNNIDPTASNPNGCTYPDPNRTLGSLYATRVGATANAMFTGVVSSGTLTVTSITGTLNLGDAITWSGQTKSDYIRGNSTTRYTLCSPNCTGASGNGTYALTGINATVGSTSMSSWNYQQWLNLADNQSKQTWDTTLTACYANQYLNAGFGRTNPCTP